ncbi:hypothetical protein GCM10023319_07120 [Nocardia iowensis]
MVAVRPPVTNHTYQSQMLAHISSGGWRNNRGLLRLIRKLKTSAHAATRAFGPAAAAGRQSISPTSGSAELRAFVVALAPASDHVWGWRSRGKAVPKPSSHR